MPSSHLVVRPTYNEASNVFGLARAILEQGESVDVLVVNDGQHARGNAARRHATAFAIRFEGTRADGG